MANLLKVNEENGSAIVEHNGRPYLIPLRTMRPFRGTYYNDHDHSSLEHRDRSEEEMEAWCALSELMQKAENSTLYRISTIGYIRNTEGVWQILPKEENDMRRKEMLDTVTKASKYVSKGPCHGVRFGSGLRKMFTLKGTTGTLMSWPRGTRRLSITDNPSGNTVATHNIKTADRMDMCFLYFYSYDEEFVEPAPSRWKARDRPVTLEVSRDATDANNGHQNMEEESLPTKRDGPETRTVMIAPETKRQRTHLLQSSERMADVFLSMHQHQWQFSLPKEKLRQEVFAEEHVRPRPSENYLFYMHTDGWMADLLQGAIFKVDTSTDAIEENDVAPIWPAVDEADHKEIGQFVQECAFQAVRRDDLPRHCAVIDAIWVRKWKRMADGTRGVKSRLCARGCHDPFKGETASKSTTATRLSQRLILAAASNNRDDVESWDIAGAFLKGLTYQDLWKHLKKLGIHTVERMIAIIPPRNVWRHLKTFSEEFNVPEHMLGDYALLCLKPVYGLSEAPLAWQLFLHSVIAELGGIQSHFDECYWYWPSSTTTTTPVLLPSSGMSTHVDDLATHGSRQWLDVTYRAMVDRFGKLTRQTLPFNHCGCRYSKIGDTFKVDQQEYVSMLKPADINDNDDERALTPAETTILRSLIGGLMWATVTRLDLLAALSQIQSVMNKAQVKHIKEANKLIRLARQHKDAATYYRPLNAKAYRIVCIHDASAASSTKNYAQEGVLVFLMRDDVNLAQEHIVCSDDFVYSRLSGAAQLLHAQSTKAKRVSYSTSHGETLAGINGLECATLVSARLSEVTFGCKPTLKQLLAVQESGSQFFPVDCHTDCRDFFELSTGVRTLPQDKSQRLYIMSHREARAAGRIRWMILTPTSCMTADALTKVMVSECLMSYLTSGIVRFWNAGHSLEMKRLPAGPEASEDMLIEGDKAILQHRAWFAAGMVMTHKSAYLLAIAMMVTPTNAQLVVPDYYTVQLNGIYHDLSYLLLLVLLILVSFISAGIAICLDRMCCRQATSTITISSATPLTASTTSGDAAGSSTGRTATATRRSSTSRNEPAVQPPPTPPPAYEQAVYVHRKAGRNFHVANCAYARFASRLAPCSYCNPVVMSSGA